MRLDGRIHIGFKIKFHSMIIYKCIYKIQTVKEKKWNLLSIFYAERHREKQK